MSFKDNFLNLIPELIFQSTNEDIPYEGPKIMKYGILTFLILIILINSFGIKKMFQIDHKVKFEEWVLISGIIETLLMLFYLLSKKFDFILTIIQAFQIIITLFITRRFLKGYLNIIESESGPNCYNTYYIILVCLNIIFILVSLFLNISKIVHSKIINDSQIHIIISFIYDIFGVLTSFILLMIGLKLKNLMIIQKEESKKEVSKKFDQNNESPNNSMNVSNDNKRKKKKFSQTFLIIEETEKDITSEDEIYFNTRILQLNVIVWVTFLTDLLEFFSSLFHCIFSNEFFENEKREEFPKTQKSYIIHLLYLFSIILSSFMNWFTFYFIVRKTFEIYVSSNDNGSKSINLNNDYKILDNLDNRDKTNQNIDKFLTLDL